jgi:phosphatidylglycerol:prolipoprotein diacylglycerol transferase
VIASVPPLAFWVDDLPPFLGPHWGNLGIRFYGLAYVLGFLTAAWLLTRYARAGRSSLPEARVGDLMVSIVIGVLVGGRLGYFLLYQPHTLISDPLAFLRLWEGGMASHGGFIGVAVALFLFSRSGRIPMLHLCDLVASTASAGILFGRVANFINGELWGRVTTVPWAVIFPRSEPDAPLRMIPPRHPSQLYEAGLEGALLLAVMQLRFWRSDIVRLQPGRLSGEYLLAYAAVRIFGEMFREPDASLILGMSRGTFYSVLMAGAGAALVVGAAWRRRPGP